MYRYQTFFGTLTCCQVSMTIRAEISEKDVSESHGGIFYSSISRRAGFVNADVKLRLKPA